MKRLIVLLLVCLLLVFTRAPALAEKSDVETVPLRIGFVGSLSSFAGNYGTAVLEGAQLAIEELGARGYFVKLVVEDDGSESKRAVSAYTKLKSVDGVRAIVGGTWWANAFAQQSARDGLPLLSCETLFDDDTVRAPTYFIMQGHLAEWVTAYEPLIAEKGLQSGAIVRYVSGFGATLARTMEQVFSRDGRRFLGTLEYGDINLPDVSDLVVKLRAMKPAALYVDASPAAVSNLLKKLVGSRQTGLHVFTNAGVVDDMRRDKLFDFSQLPSVYSVRRATMDSGFTDAFRARYRKEPYLNADLGYYAVLLITAAFAREIQQNQDPLSALREGLEVNGKRFQFDTTNVLRGEPLRVVR